MTWRPVQQALVVTALSALLIAPASAAQVLAQRSQAICSLGGVEQRTLLLNSADQWPAEARFTDARALLGREVRWATEQVVLHALAEQPSLGVRISAQRVTASGAGAMSPGPQLMLQVQRPAAGTASAMALSRPCVWALVRRSPAPQWRVRVADPASKVLQHWLAVRVPG